MKTMHSIIAFVCRMFVLLICIHVFAGYGSSEILAVQPDSSAVSRLHPQAAPVVIWNRTIVVFRLNSEEISPGERAKFAIERMNQMPINLPEYRVVAVDGIEGGHRLAWVKVNGALCSPSSRASRTLQTVSRTRFIKSGQSKQWSHGFWLEGSRMDCPSYSRLLV